MTSTIDTHTGVKGSWLHRAGGLIAAALGVALLAVGVLGQARLGSQAAAPADRRIDPYWTYEEDVVLSGNPAAVAGETPCPLGGTAPCGQAARDPWWAVSDAGRPGFAAPPDSPPVPTGVTDSETLRFHEDNAAPAADFAPDRFTYREDRRVEDAPPCVYASAAGIPGEGCAPGAPDPMAASGTNDFAMNWCSETAGPFACAATPRATANRDWAIYDGTRSGFLEPGSGVAGFVPDQFNDREDQRGEKRDLGVVNA